MIDPLNNWRKHHEDHGPQAVGPYDWYSSAWSFPDWLELAGEHFMRPPPAGYEPLVVRRPATWLLRIGWKQHGPMSYGEVPSTK